MKALFEIGQKIVCIDSNGVPLIEGKCYTVTGFEVCSYCGLTAVNINIPLQKKYSGLVHCNKCDRLFNDLSNEESFRQTRFIPLEFDRQADEEIKTALNEGLKIKNL